MGRQATVIGKIRARMNVITTRLEAFHDRRADFPAAKGYAKRSSGFEIHSSKFLLRSFGLLGESRVNVLLLNLDLERIEGSPGRE